MPYLIGTMNQETLKNYALQMFAQNETNFRYRLTKIDMGKSGYTFGICQHDCGQRADARTIIEDCLKRANTPRSQIDPIIATLKNHTLKLSPTQIDIVNQALSLKVNQSVVDILDTTHINQSMQKIYTFVSRSMSSPALPQTAAKVRNQILNDPKCFLQLLDYNNQFNMTSTGGMFRFLTGQGEKESIDESKINTDLIGQMRHFINNKTKHGINNPHDCERRQHNIDHLFVPDGLAKKSIPKPTTSISVEPISNVASPQALTPLPVRSNDAQIPSSLSLNNALNQSNHILFNANGSHEMNPSSNNVNITIDNNPPPSKNSFKLNAQFQNNIFRENQFLQNDVTQQPIVYGFGDPISNARNMQSASIDNAIDGYNSNLRAEFSSSSSINNGIKLDSTGIHFSGNIGNTQVKASSDYLSIIAVAKSAGKFVTDKINMTPEQRNNNNLEKTYAKYSSSRNEKSMMKNSTKLKEQVNKCRITEKTTNGIFLLDAIETEVNKNSFSKQSRSKGKSLEACKQSLVNSLRVEKISYETEMNAAISSKNAQKIMEIDKKYSHIPGRFKKAAEPFLNLFKNQSKLTSAQTDNFRQQAVQDGNGDLFDDTIKHLQGENKNSSPTTTPKSAETSSVSPPIIDNASAPIPLQKVPEKKDTQDQNSPKENSNIDYDAQRKRQFYEYLLFRGSEYAIDQLQIDKKTKKHLGSIIGGTRGLAFAYENGRNYTSFFNLTTTGCNILNGYLDPSQAPKITQLLDTVNTLNIVAQGSSAFKDTVMSLKADTFEVMDFTAGVTKLIAIAGPILIKKALGENRENAQEYNELRMESYSDYMIKTSTQFIVENAHTIFSLPGDMYQVYNHSDILLGSAGSLATATGNGTATATTTATSGAVMNTTASTVSAQTTWVAQAASYATLTNFIIAAVIIGIGYAGYCYYHKDTNPKYIAYKADTALHNAKVYINKNDIENALQSLEKVLLHSTDSNMKNNVLLLAANNNIYSPDIHEKAILLSRSEDPIIAFFFLTKEQFHHKHTSLFFEYALKFNTSLQNTNISLELAQTLAASTSYLIESTFYDAMQKKMFDDILRINALTFASKQDMLPAKSYLSEHAANLGYSLAAYNFAKAALKQSIQGLNLIVNTNRSNSEENDQKIERENYFKANIAHSKASMSGAIVRFNQQVLSLRPKFLTFFFGQYLLFDLQLFENPSHINRNINLLNMAPRSNATNHGLFGKYNQRDSSAFTQVRTGRILKLK